MTLVITQHDHTQTCHEKQTVLFLRVYSPAACLQHHTLLKVTLVTKQIKKNKKQNRNQTSQMCVLSKLTWTHSECAKAGAHN